MALALTVVEEPAVSAYVDAAIRREPRFEAVWEALKWRIAREPGAGFHLVDSNPPAFVLRTADTPGFPILRAVYVYEAKRWRVVIKRVSSLRGTGPT